MKNTFLNTGRSLFLVLLLGIGTAYVSAEWVPPCGDPSSGCNALPPIHEGPEAQVKEGGLSVESLGVRSGATVGYVLTASDENGTAEWKPALGGGLGSISIVSTAMTKQNTEYTASCPNGKVAISGGVKPETYATNNAITASHPSPETGTPTAWKCSKVGFGTCYAVCVGN